MAGAHPGVDGAFPIPLAEDVDDERLVERIEHDEILLQHAQAGLFSVHTADDAGTVTTLPCIVRHSTLPPPASPMRLAGCHASAW